LPVVSKVTNANGTRLLSGLFQEITKGPRENCPYSIKDYDNNGKVSLYRLYMEEMDPTEYRFANTHLADWQHWKNLCALEWFQPYVERWREELELKLKAEALSRMIKESREDGREGVTATKYLLEKGWEKESKTHGRGRPSKDEIKKAAHVLAVESNQVEEHFKRLNSPQGFGGIVVK
jgi:hypothetical protein